MPLIITDQPSSGKPVVIFIPTATNSGFVNTSWFTVLEAPYFSIPEVSEDGVPDPGDSGRELRPGETFVEAPLVVTNTTATSRWVELQVLLQGASGQAIPITQRVVVPASETIYIPIQGLRLLKTDYTDAVGGRLQIRAEVNNALRIFGSASELEASDHAPDSD